MIKTKKSPKPHKNYSKWASLPKRNKKNYKITSKSNWNMLNRTAPASATQPESTENLNFRQAVEFGSENGPTPTLLIFCLQIFSNIG